MKRFSEWTAAAVALHNQRVSKPNQIPVPADAVEDESELHADIRAECRRRGWMCFGGDMSHRTRRNLGECDFCVVTDLDQEDFIPGRVLWIEAKTRIGKLSPGQVANAAGLWRLGHTVHIVRSMSDFLALTK